MDSRFSPADLGDLGMRHEVNVFVFRATQTGLEYLLLQPRPRHESSWRPVVQAVSHNEDLFRAAIRGVRAETGLDFAFDLVCPAPGILQEIGDMQLVEWPFGYQVRDPYVPLRRRPQLAATHWMSFKDALHHLDHSAYRQNLLLLHSELQVA